jgi:DNA ligase-associated metallophosphoesterase
MITIKVKTNHFVLHPSGGIYWKEKQTWLMADVHLGKVAHFRKNGIAVPRNAEGSFYQKTHSLLSLFPVSRILFLGDLFHSDHNNEWFLFEAWVKKHPFEITLIAGNHDVISPKKFETLGIKVKPHHAENDFFFTHFPDPPTEQFVICGHLHPGVKLTGLGKQQMKFPCFYQSTNQLILPAFGAFTGLCLVKPKKEDKIYITTGKEVVEIHEKL